MAALKFIQGNVQEHTGHGMQDLLAAVKTEGTATWGQCVHATL